MKDCIFCKIIQGEIPSQKIYENDKIYAFLDIGPINHGHSLIIPKEHHASLTTVPEEYLAAMMQFAPKLGKALMKATDSDGFNLHLSNGACAGQMVFHSHLHVLPRSATDGFSWGWRTLKYENDEQCSQLANDLSALISK